MRSTKCIATAKNHFLIENAGRGGKVNMRILGIDYGHKRVGLALSDPLGITAQPLRVVSRKESIAAIAGLVADENITKIVLGLPLSMDGSESEKTLEVKKFSRVLEKRVSVGIEFYDERLSSAAVDRVLIEQADISREKRKKVRDKLAACIVLQGYLDLHRNNTP